MEFDADGSPYIALPAPHSNIIITPPRLEDGPVMVDMMNDPRVYMNIMTPPFPYALKDWELFLPIIQKLCSDALVEWKELEKCRNDATEAGEEEGKRWMGNVPVQSLREIDPETKEQKYIGSIGIRRGGFLATRDVVERKRLAAQNASRKAGDPLIEWEIGYLLVPAVHGRGIMPLALRTLMYKFWVPHMNVQHLTGGYFDHNSASRRVFEKNGFVYLEHVQDAVELQESKTGVKGKMGSLTFMKWEPSEKTIE